MMDLLPILETPASMSLYDTVQVHMIEHHFIALPAEHGYAPVAKVLLTRGANADISLRDGTPSPRQSEPC